ncbi:ABC transporter substrate-binding protein [Novosphingobium sp. BL-52-GroH]|uniref:ABC transporter substrate-binding protein n=1 Tax=Novosphingobium sp. BL-52-GroH TaxID=3349877 RepID=UPI00384B9B1C
MLSKRPEAVSAKRSPVAAFRLVVLLAGLTLASCSSYDNSAIDVAVVGNAGDPFEEGTRLAPAGQLVRAATAEGLVAFDEAGRVIPALADRWIVTDDGQSYIFRLREGNWPDGDPLTADSARKAIRATLKDLADTPLALDLGGIDEVRAMAGRVIEIRLNRPMPYLLQLLAQPELGLDHDGRGAGPMTVTRSGKVAALTRIEPSRLGLPIIENWAQRTRKVQLHALPGPAAIEAFNEGQVDLVLGGQIQDFMLTRSVGILRGTIQLDPVIGLFGLQVMRDKGFLADPANREALAMAIDRPALIAPFGVGGWSPTTRIVTPSLDGDLGTIGERWGEQSLEDRRAVAAARVRGWLAGQGGGAPGTPVALHVWLPEGGGSRLLFDRLLADFATIGVRLEKAANADGADLALVDDVARYPRAAWFLNRLSCRARRGLCSPEADARVAEAAIAPSPAERAALLTEAEAELTATNVFIPFGTPIRWSLVRGSVDGFATNAWGWHPLMPLSWLPK